MHTVSVVIPTYNYGRFIARAIDSALGQTATPAEVIVVDDGSTDDTDEVLARYAGRIRVLRQANRGVSAARNAGIDSASGDFVAFLDSDDLWLPTKLERQIELFERYPASGAIGCGVQVIRKELQVLRTVVFPDAIGHPHKRIRRLALRRSWVGGSSSGALLPRAVLARVGAFDETLWGAEDWDLWLRIGAAYEVRNVAEPLVCVFDHRSGTFRNAERMAQVQLEVLQKLAREVPRAVAWPYGRRIRALIEADAAGELYGGGQWSACARRARRAVGAWPFDAASWRLLLGASIRSLRPGDSVD
ncbi:MAG: glycosyltransferase family 2 protein [Steroidobacteraceae bacterium]